MEWIPLICTAFIAGWLCGVVGLCLRVFRPRGRAGRRLGKAAVCVGLGSLVLFFLLERGDLSLPGYLCIASPVVPGVLTLAVPENRGVGASLRIVLVLLAAATVGTASWYGYDTSLPGGAVAGQPVGYSEFHDSTPIANPFGIPPATDARGELLSRASSGEKATAAGVEVDVPFLKHFSGPDRQLLLRHLATSAEWFVGRDLVNGQEKRVARRRFLKGGMWLGGSGWHAERGSQFGIVFGLEGPTCVNVDGWRTTAVVARPDQGAVALNPFHFPSDPAAMLSSCLAVESPGATLEIYEVSERTDRPVTAAALSQLNQEFEAVLSSPAARRLGFDPALVPPESIRRGSPDMHLLTSDPEDGLYQLQAYVNPGESGYVYSKAFYGRGNIRILDDSYFTRQSIEYTGWSDDPGQLFLYSAPCNFWVATFSDSYPARVELWFVPASGGTERRLLAKYFNVR